MVAPPATNRTALLIRGCSPAVRSTCSVWSAIRLPSTPVRQPLRRSTTRLSSIRPARFVTRRFTARTRAAFSSNREEGGIDGLHASQTTDCFLQVSFPVLAADFFGACTCLAVHPRRAETGRNQPRELQHQAVGRVRLSLGEQFR